MIILQTIRFVIVDVIIQIIYFPVWWYTEGTMKVIRHLVLQLRSLIHSLSLGILFKFLFQPMYGQADIAGRIISFFVRIVHFGALLLWTILYSIFLCAVLLLWLVLPIFVLYSILYHLSLLPEQFAIL